MASVPHAKSVTCEELSLTCSQIVADGILQPKLFPHVQVDIARIWPD